jgi:hypothetical protein
MSIIRFSETQRRSASQVELGSNHPGEVVVRIEEAEGCEGLDCAERLELALSTEEYAQWLEFHTERTSVERHSHLVVHGRSPATVPKIIAVFRGQQ